MKDKTAIFSVVYSKNLWRTTPQLGSTLASLALTAALSMLFALTGCAGRNATAELQGVSATPPSALSTAEANYSAATATAIPESVDSRPTNQPSGAPKPPEPVRPQDPVANIRTFAGTPNLQAERGARVPGPFGTTDVYTATLVTGELARFKVDAETGEVLGFALYGQAAGEVKVSAEEAQAIALAFTRDHYQGFDAAAFTLRQAGLVDHGDQALRFYSYWWVQIDSASGALLPAEVRVQVNSRTGAVEYYSAVRAAASVPTQPKLDRPAAEGAAVNAVEGLENAKPKDALLSVMLVPLRVPTGKQALLWQVAVEGKPDEQGYVPGAIVFLDALTGEVIAVEPYW